MNVQYVNPFIHASYAVLETILGRRPEKGELTAQATTFVSQECSVVCGVAGQVQGQVIYGMSVATADKIASAMLGQQIESFDALAASAIAELGNMISGNALRLLAESNWICDITPPTLVTGANVTISTISIPAVVIPMKLDQGLLYITVGLHGRK